MNNKKIITKNAPLPIGPYTQATEANGFLFISGQIALNPQSGDLVNSNITEETHQVMRNIEGVLKAAELDFSHIVKSSILLIIPGAIDFRDVSFPVKRFSTR